MRPVHAIPVELSRAYIGKIGVPHELGALPELDPGGLFPVFRMVEETQVDARCMLRE